ncbi:hypothetical protein KKH36_04155 [Patescibacteria group bacterium]|nr:hypothetical protein [Patescibacteria group bacterium]
MGKWFSSSKGSDDTDYEKGYDNSNDEQRNRGNGGSMESDAWAEAAKNGDDTGM